MYSTVRDWRNKNNIMFDTTKGTFQNYYADVQKKEMKHSYGEDLLNNLHLLPDPLMKNLADTVVTTDQPKQKVNKTFLNVETVEKQMLMPEPVMHDSVNMPSFSVITNFFSGVVNVISSAVAQLRPRNSTNYNSYDSNVSRQGSPDSWQAANTGDQNKNERAHNLISNAQTDLQSDMNVNCHAAAAQCEEKLNKVRLLLTTKPVATPKFRSRRPRKAFVEAGSVSDSFEDAFSPEDFVSLPSDQYIEYYSALQFQPPELVQTDSPKMKIEKHLSETTEIVTTLPDVDTSHVNDGKVENNPMNVTQNCKSDLDDKKQIVKAEEPGMQEKPQNKTIETVNKENKIVKENPKEVIVSCEDKLSKLKALLQHRRKNNKTITSTQESIDNTDLATKPPKVPTDKTQDKRFKNPCRKTEKRQKAQLKQSIQDDMVFANEINQHDLSSVDNSPLDRSLHIQSSIQNDSPASSISPGHNIEYFDEVKGRFRSTSTTDSEDSFQIVFSDSPKTRTRVPSDCDSEDSFIVFEDSPDSCYTSNEVFGESSDYDTDSDDSGCEPVGTLLTRTYGDLTDDSLYEDKVVDEVDCAVRTVCEEIPSEVLSTGLLMNDAKKQLRRSLPAKKVHFSTQPPKVHIMRVWSFAARQARAGHWERCALDRDRFKRRIADVDMAVSWVLKPQHRSRVMFQRFMPWWNAQKRKELAEKKQKAEEDKLKAEAEKLAVEEKRIRDEVDKVLGTDVKVENRIVDSVETEGVNEEIIQELDNDDKEKDEIVVTGEIQEVKEEIDVKNVQTHKEDKVKTEENVVNEIVKNNTVKGNTTLTHVNNLVNGSVD